MRIPASQPLLPFALAFAAGIILNLELNFFHPAFFLLVPLALLIAAAFAFALGFGNRAGLPWAFLAVFLVGALNSEREKQKLSAADSLLEFVHQNPVRLVGRLAEPVMVFPGYSRLVVEAETAMNENRTAAVSGRVMVTVGGTEPPAVRRGDRLLLVLNLRQPQSFRNPGGFRYEDYLARRGIIVTANARNAREILRLAPGPRWHPLVMVDQVRERLAKLIQANAPKHGELLKALVLGEENAVPEAVWRAFRDTGLAHLLSISGLHLGMVTAMGFWLFRFLFSCSEWLMLRFNIRRLAAGMSLVLVIGYALLAGASVPTQRALIMVAVYVAALIFGKTYPLWNALWLALLIILCWWPAAILEASLQLSFAAVMGILYLLPRLWLIFPQTRLSFVPDPLPQPESASFTRRYHLWKIGRYFFNLCFVSLAAQFGIALLSARYFHQLNPFAVLHNLAAVPIVEFLLLPAGLLVSAVALPFPAVGGFGFQLLEHLSAGTERIISGFGSWPGVFILVRAPSWTEIILGYGFLILALETLILSLRKSYSWNLLQPDTSFRAGPKAKPAPSPASQAHPKSRRLGAGAFICLALLLSLQTTRLVRSRLDRDFRLTAIDVGAGQSLLVQTPDHSRFLIDGGGLFNQSYDIGANVVAPYLLNQGIHRLSAVILTHPHPDHGNGLIYLLEHFPIGEFWLTADRNFLSEELLTIAARRRIPIRILDDQTPVITRGESQIQVLHPPPGPAAAGADLNDHSLVLLLSFRDQRFLLPADLTARAERLLLKHLGAEALKARVLIAPHHGSKSSSSPEFLDAVQPQIAVFSARPGGWWQMPHPEVLQRYRSRNIHILRTDQHGAITIRTNGEDLKIETTVNQP